MADIVFETIRAAIMVVLLGHTYFYVTRHELSTKGWNLIVFGLSFLVLGSLWDITDNFPQLNRFVIVGDTEVQAFLEKMVFSLIGWLALLVGFMRWLPTLVSVDKIVKAYNELAHANDTVSVLSGLLPICASCKRIENDENEWQSVEKYISNRAKVQFTHSICPECQAKLYPQTLPDATS